MATEDRRAELDVESRIETPMLMLEVVAIGLDRRGRTESPHEEPLSRAPDRVQE